ncbi:sugar phosphate isomerase/epimerase family protein [Paenibacillus abyssi]|uniref:Epimerase n=1 Tax=Paenibacillus abyssi TaxID=1340531 RepID=A0A917D0F8_9BACL|nr:sugar phosphate isomerase/epimerase family protein [Paenibacillus abyssi]GGG02890.1 epimerase [Paenibacillus abyssi]
MYKYSATQWIFGKEDVETSLNRLKRFGYDGVELAGEPYTMDLSAIQELMGRYGMECTSICGIYTAERDLSSASSETRQGAIHYVKACVDMAVQLGASVVIVVPSPVGKGAPDTTTEEAWDHAVQSLREAGDYASGKNIKLAIEALNRFETHLVNKLEVARKLAEQVDRESVGLMADLFHMNIEERNHRETLLNIAPYLMHVHIADNTREAAGLGMTNFREVFQTLQEMGYKGSITMEFLPPVAYPYAASQREEADDLFDHFTDQSIRHIKEIVAELV